MKTLMLTGSPRPQGDSAALWAAMRAMLRGTVDEVSAYRDGIFPCIDCRHCWKKPGCAIEDGMQSIYAGLPAYDNIILVSPLYFSQLTGPLLGLLSRAQALWAGPFFRGEKKPPLSKQGVLLLSGGGDGSPAPAEGSARVALRQLGARYLGCVASLHTNDLPARRDEKALAEARALGLRLNALYYGRCVAPDPRQGNQV